MTHAQTCPICEGRGFMPRKFYGKKGGGTENCRSCYGSGYVVVSDPAAVVIKEVPVPYPQPIYPYPWYPQVWCQTTTEKSRYQSPFGEGVRPLCSGTPARGDEVWQ